MGSIMATEKRQFTMRMQDKTYEKIRYLAFVDRRSVAMEIEHILLKYITAYEAEHGAIVVPTDELFEYPSTGCRWALNHRPLKRAEGR